LGELRALAAPAGAGDLDGGADWKGRVVPDHVADQAPQEVPLDAEAAPRVGGDGDDLPGDDVRELRIALAVDVDEVLLRGEVAMTTGFLSTTPESRDLTRDRLPVHEGESLGTGRRGGACEGGYSGEERHSAGAGGRSGDRSQGENVHG
jgi:hypothetical protein